jgi:hypothetical protein
MKTPSYLVYDDRVISVALFAENADADAKHLLSLGIRWLRPETIRGRDGSSLQTTNAMGGETEWFLLPHSFGAAVARTMIEQKVADCGLADSINGQGFKRMVAWLVEMEELTDAMCY